MPLSNLEKLRHYISVVEKSIERKKADGWSSESAGFLWTDIESVKFHPLEANYLTVTITFTWGEQNSSEILYVGDREEDQKAAETAGIEFKDAAVWRGDVE